jgi:hypothetical protein
MKDRYQKSTIGIDDFKLKFSLYMVKSMRLQTRPTVKEGDLAGL